MQPQRQATNVLRNYMTSPIFQKQHRIPQVYLRKFGYKKGDKWYVSVWEKSKDHTDNVLIEEFTTETNIFDLPFDEDVIKRHFENTSQKIETQFNTIINTLKRQGKLIHRHKDLLCHFTANLICRSKAPREYFHFLLNHKTGLNYILEEITMFKPDELAQLRETFPLIPSDLRLNFAIGYIMNYLVRILQNFSFVILEAIPEKGWLTSDNPVYIDPQEEDKNRNEYLYIIPIESEIYFPLTPDYCLFCFHKKSQKNSNPLRKLLENKVSKVNDETHDQICKFVTGNDSEFFIFNQEMEKFNLAD